MHPRDSKFLSKRNKSVQSKSTLVTFFLGEHHSGAAGAHIIEENNFFRSHKEPLSTACIRRDGSATKYDPFECKWLTQAILD
jgi:hypothetical protein